jgi:hypothetical protein
MPSEEEEKEERKKGQTHFHFNSHVGIFLGKRVE